MMHIPSDPIPFTVPLSTRFHQCAQDFYGHHADSHKAKQVYLNTLSILSVQFYLACLGFDTDLDRGASWNPALQVLADTADLWVEMVGMLECRPVLPGQEFCYIPAQVWGDRVAYVAVQFDPDLTTATVVGFVPSVDTERVPLTALQSLDDLLDHLEALAIAQAPTSQNVIDPTPNLTDAAMANPDAPPSGVAANLRQWLNEAATEVSQSLETGWSTLEQVLDDLQAPSPAYQFRAPLSAVHEVERPSTGVKRGKVLALNRAVNASIDEKVLLLLGVAPSHPTPLHDEGFSARESARTPQSSVTEYCITVELYPMGGQAYLPRSLHLAVLDEDRHPVLQADGRNSEGLELQFSGEPGEQFSVRVQWDAGDMLETFEI